MSINMVLTVVCIYRVDVRMDGYVNGWTVNGEINGNTDMIV